MKIIKMVSKMNNLDVMLVQLNTGLRLCSLIREKGKYLELYNPLTIIYGVSETGEEFIKLIPYQLPMTVDSSNTMIRKNDCHLFVPSDTLKAHYLSRVIAVNNAKNPTKKKAATKVEKKDVTNGEANNVIDFSKFRKYKDAANTSNNDPLDVA